MFSMTVKTLEVNDRMIDLPLSLREVEEHNIFTGASRNDVLKYLARQMTGSEWNSFEKKIEARHPDLDLGVLYSTLIALRARYSKLTRS